MDNTAAATAALNDHGPVWRWLRRAYAVLAVGVLVWLLWQLPGAWRHLADMAQPFHAAAFVACWVAMVGSLGVLWRLSLRALCDADIDLRTALSAQASAWAGRDLPGKVGLLAGKLTLAGRAGLGARQLAGSVVFEQFAFVAAGLALGAAFANPANLRTLLAPDLPLDTFDALFRLIAATGAAIAAAAAIFLAIRVSGREGNLPRLVGLLVLHLIPHVLCGMGLIALLASTPGQAAVASIEVVGAMAASNVAGVVAIFAPAGLGVREAVLISLLAPTTGSSGMVALAALVRILATIGDVIVIGVGTAVGLRQNRESA